MLYYIATSREQYTIRKHLRHYGQPVAGFVRPRSYSQLFRAGSLPAGAYIFADIERLGPAEIQRATHIRKALVDRGCLVLNDPVRSMRRYELLRTMYERGINRTNVYHVTEQREPRSYPVFVRGENDHNGSQSDLLNNRDELHAAIGQMTLRGINREQLIITEFCDTRDASAVYRKYSAFVVRGIVIPRHVFFGRAWMLKAPDLLDQEHLDEEYAYHLANPHEDQLRTIFAAARIDYGRIDYGVEAGHIRVWEINTNPMISTPYDAQIGCRARIQERFAPAFNQSLKELASSAPADNQRVILPPLPVAPRAKRSIWRRVTTAFRRRAA